MISILFRFFRRNAFHIWKVPSKSILKLLPSRVGRMIEKMVDKRTWVNRRLPHLSSCLTNSSYLLAFVQKPHLLSIYFYFYFIICPYILELVNIFWHLSRRLDNWPGSRHLVLGQSSRYLDTPDIWASVHTSRHLSRWVTALAWQNKIRNCILYFSNDFLSFWCYSKLD